MKQNLNAHLSVIFATFIVATTFPIGKYLAPYLDPATLVLFRFLLSIAVMLPIFFFSTKISIPNKKRFAQYAILGLLYSCFFILMLLSLRYTTSLNTSVIYTLVPSIAAIVSLVVLRESITRLHFILLPLGILTTAWVIFGGNWNLLLKFSLNDGDLIFGLGCISLGAYSTLLKKFHIGDSPFNMVFWSMVCGSIPLLLYYISIATEVDLLVIPPGVYLWTLYLSVMTVITSFIWVYGTPLLGPVKTLGYSYLIPSFVLLLNWTIFSDLPAPIVLPGVLFGLVVMFFLQRIEPQLKQVPVNSEQK